MLSAPNTSVKSILPCLLMLTLAACGGGGGGDGSSRVRPGGIWLGTGTTHAQPDQVIQTWAISTDAGEFRIGAGAPWPVVTLSGEGGQLSGSSTVGSGGSTRTITWDISLTEHEALQGRWTSSEGESGDFVMAWQDRHLEPSPLDVISGTYTSVQGFTIPGVIADNEVALTADPSGLLIGADTLGCVYGGRMQIIDSRYNVYRVNLDISNCPIAGSLTGLGTYDPDYMVFWYHVSSQWVSWSHSVSKDPRGRAMLPGQPTSRQVYR